MQTTKNRVSKSSRVEPSDASRYNRNPFPDRQTLGGQSTSGAISAVNFTADDWISAATRSLEFVTRTYSVPSLLRESKFRNDYTLYTGSAGVAYACWRLYRLFGTSTSASQSPSQSPSQSRVQPWLSHAFEYLQCARQQLKRNDSALSGDKRSSFLCGAAGVYALAAVLHAESHNAADSERYVQKLLDAEPTAAKATVPCEFLYGRAGYLYALMWVRKDAQCCLSPALQERLEQVGVRVIRDIFGIGRAYSQANGYQQQQPRDGDSGENKTPLMFAWHRSPYLGAAHGLAGILYQLLNAREACPAWKREIPSRTLFECAQFLLGQVFPSGNFPSQPRSQSDKLVQWCHGASGIIPLLTRVHRLLSQRQEGHHSTTSLSLVRITSTAAAAGEAVWRRGLLRKGPGVCHGIGSGMYAFLALYRMTGDDLWLQRASAFGLYSLHNAPRGIGQRTLQRSKLARRDRELWMRPDEPYCLFNGMAGAAVAFMDMASPLTASFPCFDL